MLSEAEEEYDEMLLKAQPLLDAVSLARRQRAAQPRHAASSAADEDRRADGHALVEQLHVGDVHADAAVRCARADRVVLAGAVDADAVGDPIQRAFSGFAALPPPTVVPASSPAQGLFGTDQTGLICLSWIAKRPFGVGYAGWPTATL